MSKLSNTFVIQTKPQFKKILMFYFNNIILQLKVFDEKKIILTFISFQKKYKY